MNQCITPGCIFNDKHDGRCESATGERLTPNAFVSFTQGMLIAAMSGLTSAAVRSSKALPPFNWLTGPLIWSIWPFALLLEAISDDTRPTRPEES